GRHRHVERLGRGDAPNLHPASVENALAAGAWAGYSHARTPSESHLRCPVPSPGYCSRCSRALTGDSAGDLCPDCVSAGGASVSVTTSAEPGTPVLEPREADDQVTATEPLAVGA